MVLCFILKLLPRVHCSGFGYYPEDDTQGDHDSNTLLIISQLHCHHQHSIILTTHLQINNKVLTGAEFSNVLETLSQTTVDVLNYLKVIGIGSEPSTHRLMNIIDSGINVQVSFVQGNNCKSNAALQFLVTIHNYFWRFKLC